MMSIAEAALLMETDGFQSDNEYDNIELRKTWKTMKEKSDVICVIYTFKAPTLPWGEVLVTRLTNRSSSFPGEAWIWADNYIKQNPNCTELSGIRTTEFVDDTKQEVVIL